PIDFIRRDMQQAERGALARFEAAPITQGFLQQGECSDDIRLDELTRAIDGTVHMTFGCKVHDGLGSVAIEQRAQFRTVADVDLGKYVARMCRRLRDGRKVRCISQLVDIDHARAGMIKKASDDGGADESGTSSHKYGIADKFHADGTWLCQ